MKATLKNIQAHIDKKYPDLGIEFVRGRGYFYFVTDDPGLEIDSIYVCYLKQCSLERWVEMVDGNIEDAIKEACE